MPLNIADADIETNSVKIDFLENSKYSSMKLSWRYSVKQILAAIIAHSLVIHAGINIAFSSVLLPQLSDKNSEININLNEASWIASIVTASLPLGALTIGPLMDKFGRKKMCILTTVPFILSWILHCFATNVWHIYVGRIIAGFGAGLSTVGIVYVSEISHPKYRPMLLTFNSVFVTSGILLTCILGFGLHWKIMVKIFLALIVLSLIGLTFIPESPYWLVVFKNDKQKCAKSMKWLYPEKGVFEEQYERVLQSTRPILDDHYLFDKKLRLIDKIKKNFYSYKEPTIWKPFVILLGLFIFQQLSSGYVIIFYAVDIFRRIGGNFKNIGLINEFVALILLGGIRFSMSIILAIISKKIGRRILMFISTAGMSVISFAIGIFMFIVHENKHFKDSDGTVAVILVLCYICLSSFGSLVIPWTLIGEILPVKVRGVLGGILVSVAYLLMFTIVKIAPFLMDRVPFEYIFLGLSAINVFGLIFTYLFLPETLGKTFADIASYFDQRLISSSFEEYKV